MTERSARTFHVGDDVVWEHKYRTSYGYIFAILPGDPPDSPDWHFLSCKPRALVRRTGGNGAWGDWRDERVIVNLEDLEPCSRNAVTA